MVLFEHEEQNLNVSRTQLLVDRLRALQSSTPEIEGAAIVSSDGLSIASVLAADIEEDRVAAMSAAMRSPLTITAPSSMMPSVPRALPRCGPPCSVSTWEAEWINIRAL